MINKLKPPNIFSNQPAKHKTRDKVLNTFTLDSIQLQRSP